MRAYETMCIVDPEVVARERDVVEDRRDDADAHVGRERPDVLVQELRRLREVAQLGEAADAHDHAEEEQQRVPLDVGHVLEDVDGCLVPAAPQPAL